MYFLQITFIIASLSCILGSDETVYEEVIKPIIVPKLGARGKPRCPRETDIERYQEALIRWSAYDHDVFGLDQSNYTILDVASQIVGWIRYYYTIQLDTGLCYEVLLNDQSIDFVDNVECPEFVMDCPEAI
ncbi:hypothetical protein PHET_05303 [Paragonimus heterotremus]|uniref:Cystatin domain-containing protein n=1 Tax=Paragonimus heterotremus TaxID=100268 RepID=A0A8J4SM18_9TREM|nr:hypothetical protein PHET_05303 [Paragonimus heterotremus]